MRNWSVWAVHGLTATGAGIALLAAVATGRQDWQAVFLLLGLALIIDGIDGPLARAVGTAARVPWLDGERLDLVVDFVTYAFLPALVLVHSGLLSEPWATGAGIAIVMVGALYFADVRMKTDAAAFRGFPAVWNAVVFQLMVYKLPEPLTLLVVGAFAVLTFTPVEFVHPIRVTRWRPVTLTMTVAWGGLALVAVVANFSPGPLIVAAFGLVSLYFIVIGVVLQVTRG